MAKKKPAGPSMGLILTLIFFVLATFTLGTLTYLGFESQAGYIEKEKKAKEGEKAALIELEKEKVRRIIYRVAMGIDTPEDREDLYALSQTRKADLLAEHADLVSKVAERLKDKNDFSWPLIDRVKASVANPNAAAPPEAMPAQPPGGEPPAQGDVDVKPKMTLPEMILKYRTAEQDAIAKREQALKDAEKSKADAAAAQVRETKNKEIFDTAIAGLKTDVDTFKKDMAGKFAMLQKRSDDAGKAFTKDLGNLGEERDKLSDINTAMQKNINDLKRKLEKYDNQVAAEGPDLTRLDEKKGEIVKKEGGFVDINIGSAASLRPQMLFYVIAPDASLPEVLEKEERLKKSASGLRDRQPFEDNQMVKGYLEVVEITGPYSARAKIAGELEPIRNPIQKKDQLFNLIWTPNYKEHVAFAGIIDLDGDGIDNNEDFIRILERHNVVVDSYLDLREKVIRGKGMTLQTKFLIIAPDPRLDELGIQAKDNPRAKQMEVMIGKMGEMKAKAKELGVQMIEARKFLAMVGYKLPHNPAPPAYSSVLYMGGVGDPAPPKEGDPEPKVEPKKDEK